MAARSRRPTRSRRAPSTASATSTRSSRARTSASRRASGTTWRSATVGQQFTILVDGELINQFDNAVPKIASRNGDPSTMARQFAQGYLGLQTHGGNDRISYREIQVKDLDEVATSRGTCEPPTVGGSGSVRQAADLRPRRVARRHAGRGPLVHLVPLEPGRSRSTRTTARRARSTWGSFTTPADPRYGTQPLTWLDSLIVGHGRRYTPTAADVGKVIHCAANATAAARRCGRPPRRPRSRG